MKKVLLFLGLCNLVFGAESEISAVDTLFLIACSGLVLLMTPALGMFYGGMVHRGNVLSTTINCTILFALLCVQWVILGYTLAFGDDVGQVVGNLNHIFLINIQDSMVGLVSENLFAFFQMLFAVIGAAIITGSFVERMRFGVLLIFILCWSTLVYDILAHWVWGGGWLMNIGSLDFAGGGVVHIAAGVAGLVGCLMLGKRKFRKGILPHSLPLSFIGAIFLWIGWLGFNTGSALSVNSVAVNAFLATNFAVAGAMISWVIIEWTKYGKPTLLGSITGIVAGLVAITPSAGFVTPFSAIAIGFLVSPICFFAISLMKSKLGYDDTLDAFGLHGVGGIWGGIATGLFATSSVNEIVSKEAVGEGLFYSGNFDLLFVQILAIIACFVLSAFVSFVVLKIISMFVPLRVEEAQEENGLDQSLHGEIAYR